MSVLKIGKSWWIDFSYKFERCRQRSPLNTRSGAHEYELFLRGEVAKLGSVQEALKVLRKRPVQPLTFAEFADQWLRDYVDVNNKPSVQRSKRAALRVHLIPTFGKYPLAEITVRMIEQFKYTEQQLGLSAKTINNILSTLRKCLVTAVGWELLNRIPSIQFLRATKPPIRYLRTEQYQALLNAAPDQLWKTMILVALKTGLRHSELIALEWSDIDLSRRVLCVSRACVEGHLGSPKNHHIRYVDLTSDVIEALQSIKGSSPVVFHKNGQRIAGKHARYKLAKIYRTAGMRPMGWHILRHTFATELAARGAPIHVIKELLGHATIEMTMRYAHITPASRSAAMGLLEPSREILWQRNVNQTIETTEFDCQTQQSTLNFSRELAKTATHM